MRATATLMVAVVEAGARAPAVLLGAVVAVALGVRLAIVAAAGPPELYEYDRLARNLLAGHGYVVTFLGTTYTSLYAGVFYVWLTAALYAAFPPGYTAVLLAQALIASGLVVATFFLGRALAGPWTGVVAALLAALHPAFVYYDARKLHPLGFDATLVVLSILALLAVRRTRTISSALAAGLVIGVAILQRGNLVLVPPLAAAWLWLTGPRDRRTLVVASVCLLGTGLVVAPWIARNYLIHGVPVMMTTMSEHFWLGNAPHSYGSNLLPTGQTVLEAAPAAFRAEVLSLDELGQYRAFWRAALADAAARPWGFAAGLARKFVLFWSFGPQSGILYPSLYLPLYAVYYALVVALACVGCSHLLRGHPTRAVCRPGLALLVMTALSVAVVHSIFYVEVRHRWEIEPLLLVLSAAGLLSLRRPELVRPTNT